jgi:hypothetical protein
MLLAFTIIAVLIICTVIVVLWMSKAPRIEEAGEEEVHTQASRFADDDLQFQHRSVESKPPKARGA